MGEEQLRIELLIAWSSVSAVRAMRAWLMVTQDE